MEMPESRNCTWALTLLQAVEGGTFLLPWFFGLGLFGLSLDPHLEQCESENWSLSGLILSPRHYQLVKGNSSINGGVERKVLRFNHWDLITEKRVLPFERKAASAGGGAKLLPWEVSLCRSLFNARFLLFLNIFSLGFVTLASISFHFFSKGSQSSLRLFLAKANYASLESWQR